jgi:hypothetical protein
MPTALQPIPLRSRAPAGFLLAAMLVAWVVVPAHPATANGAHWAEQVKVIGESGFNISAVAFDGDTLVVADASGGTFGSETIVVKVYVRDGGPWTFQQEINGDDWEWTPMTGKVDLDGDTLVVGSPRVSTVYVFHRTGTTWSRQQTITGPGDFGESVAVDGDTLAVGEPLDGDADTGSNDTSGAVYVYTRSAGGVDRAGQGAPRQRQRRLRVRPSGGAVGGHPGGHQRLPRGGRGADTGVHPIR